MMRRVLVIWACLAPLAAGAEPSTTPATAPSRQVGAFHIQFTDQSPLSPIEAQNKRHHIKIAEIQRYKLADESFEMYVPEDLDPAERCGILVFVNAGERGGVPRDWRPLLDKRHLLGIGANQSGNDRGVGVRFGLALDAVHNLKKLYPIDESRVYVSGVSGGGKVASMLAVIYPEVFRGAMPIVGSSYFRNIPVPGKPNLAYARDFDRPANVWLDRAKHGRFVFITGSDDMNRESIQAMVEQGYRKDGFQNVEYIEVPGMGHRIPEVDVIDRALGILDAPAPAKSPRGGRTK